MSNNLVGVNRQSHLQIHQGQEDRGKSRKDSAVSVIGGHKIDPKTLSSKKNYVKQPKELNYGGDIVGGLVVKDEQKAINQNNLKYQKQGCAESLDVNRPGLTSDITNSLARNPLIAIQTQIKQSSDSVNNQKLNQQFLTQQDNILGQIQTSKPVQQIQTKKQIQQKKQGLDGLQSKNKQQQRKKHLQKMNQQQKARLQQLKQQTRKFQDIKKQKDKQIMQFKSQLQSLKKNKQQQVYKQKRKEEMRQLKEQREKDNRIYRQMLLQKERLRKKQEEEEKERQQQRRREQEYLKKVNSTQFKQKLQKQEQERRKIQQIKQFLTNRNNYQQKLRHLQNLSLIKKQKSKPTIKKSQVQLKQQQRRLTTKALSAAEIYQMGQQFMEQAHQDINEEDIQQSKLFLSNLYNNSLRQSVRTECKDYLKEQKLNRERFFKSTARLKINPQIRELKKLIVKEENTPQKWLKAKLLTDKIQQKVVKKSSLKLKADSIAAKLKIIEEFS